MNITNNNLPPNRLNPPCVGPALETGAEGGGAPPGLGGGAPRVAGGGADGLGGGAPGLGGAPPGLGGGAPGVGLDGVPLVGGLAVLVATGDGVFFSVVLFSIGGSTLVLV